MAAFFERLKASIRFAVGDWRGPFLPEEVIFEVTTACNLECPMCPRTAMSPRRPNRNLSLEEFTLFAERIPLRVVRTAIAGLGEPCLNPDLPSMVRMLAKRGHKPVLYTNGTLLDRRMSLELVKAGLSGVIIPVDGVTQETYSRYRPNADLAVTERNILDLLRVKKELGSTLFVELQMLKLPGTEAELSQWRHRWTRQGVDSLRYKPDHVGLELAEPSAQLGGSPLTLPLATTPPDREGATKLRDQGAKKSIGESRSGSGVCPMPWRGPATVDIDGNVYPCCVQSPGNRLLGNLSDGTLEQLWNGPEARQVRKDFINTGRKLDTCVGCLIPLPPRLVSALGNLLDPFTARRVLSRVEHLLPQGGPRRGP